MAAVMTWLRRAGLAVLAAAACTVALAATPRDQLVIGMNMNNLLSLDPAGATGNDVLEVVANLYDYLVELDPHELTRVEPALAESWEIAPDHNSLTLVLRE